MNQSEQINELVSALCKVQAGLKPVHKDSSNPYFKSSYADLTAIWEACRSAVTANGLVVIQGGEVSGDTNILHMVTRLAHTSGQWIESVLPVPLAKSDPQGLGSAVTYARRYALCAMLGVVVTDEDDDAEASIPRETRIEDGDVYTKTDRGYERTPESSSAVKLKVDEARRLRDSAGLSNAEVKQLFGISFSTGLSNKTVDQAIDALKDFIERKNSGALTDEETALLTGERTTAA